LIAKLVHVNNKCLAELSGQDHKRVGDALVSFLKPESLKHYVGKMDESQDALARKTSHCLLMKFTMNELPFV
jgi:hypothetical protein